MIKAIIFDVGGVLVYGDLSETLQYLIKKMKCSSELFYTFFQRYKKKLNTGKIKLSELVVPWQHLSGINADLVELWKHYIAHRKFNTKLLNFAQSLGEKYRVAILSNAVDMAALGNRQRGLYRGFSPVVLSCEVGLAKPDRLIYELILQQLQVEAKECVFIDDKEKNLIVARALGMQTILFENNEKLFSRLQDLGIMPV